MFCNRHATPIVDQVLAFWGDEIYSWMSERLKSLENSKLWWFAKNAEHSVEPVLIWSDCDKSTQGTPVAFPRDCAAAWWPALANRNGTLYDPASNTYWVWCQDQAFNGCQPWRTHEDRILWLGNTHDPRMSTIIIEKLPNGRVMKSTVVIQEVDDEEVDDEEVDDDKDVIID